MSGTLRGRVTRAVTKLRTTLDAFDSSCDNYADRAQQGDRHLITELDNVIATIEDQMGACESNLEDVTEYIRTLPEQERDREDKKLEETINAENALEDTMERARASLVTLKQFTTASRTAIDPTATAPRNPANVADDDAETTTPAAVDAQRAHEDVPEDGMQALTIANNLPPRTPSAHDVETPRARRTVRVQESPLPQARPLQPTMELPRLQMPTFDGNTADFQRFITLFNATIDARADMDTSLKLHYLLSSLKGDAASLVSAYTFDVRNYESIKKTLRDRYGSRETMERRLYENLDRLRASEHESFVTFMDKLQVILNQMSTYGIDLETESIRMAIEKTLPKWTRGHLFQARLAANTWSTALMRSTLQKIAAMPNEATDAELITVVPTFQKPQKKFPRHGFKRMNKFERNTSSQKPPANLPKCAPDSSQRPRTNQPHKEQSNEVCYYCNRKGHRIAECRTRKRDNRRINTTTTVAEEITELPTVQLTNVCSAVQETPLMLTEAALVNMDTGKRVKALIFLDSGSMMNYASNALANSLGLRQKDARSLTVHCFGGSSQTVLCADARLGIQQEDGTLVEIQAKCLDKVVDAIPFTRICDDQTVRHEMRIPSLLIGNADLWKFIKGPAKETIAGYQCINSTLGKFLGGPITTHDVTSTLTATVGLDPRILDRRIEEWNNLEVIGIGEPITQDDDELALQTLKERIRYENGRYSVPLPFKDDHPIMPDNLGLCVKQLVGLRTRMLSKPTMMHSADKIVKEWLDNDIIEEVPKEELQHAVGQLVVYAPFHLVAKESSKSTPFRLVHNGSAALKGAPSLNKLLCRGPVLLPNLVGVMIRFRESQVVATSDVEKAFLQLGLQEEYRDALRFIYPKNWKDPIHTDGLIHYRFKRINFGLVSSPFLLAGTLNLHFEKLLPFGPEILRDSYVDNILTRGDTPQEALQKMLFVEEEMTHFGMKLSQYYSNDPSLQTRWKQEDMVCKYLGIQWDTHADLLMYDFSNVKVARQTKRGILSALCQCYDPLGLMFPTLLKWKLLVQDLWRKELDWDQPIDHDDAKQFQELMSSNMKLHIPRLATTSDDVHLVVFTDASKSAFAAVAYLVTEGYTPELLICRARLAPLKGSTIPKLELLGVLIGARLVNFIKHHTSKRIRSTTLYSDSMIVLHWILNEEADVPRFNHHRLVEIRATDCEFRYVNTKLNPADIATRGATTSELSTTSLWWNGPPFLSSPKEQWPHEEIRKPPGFPTVEKEVNATTIVHEPVIQPERFSSFEKLLHTMMFVILFIQRLSSGKRACGKPPEHAIRRLILEAQRRHPPTDDQIRNLRMVQDEHGLWRSRGRLQNSALAADARMPLFLPKNDALTKLLIMKLHKDCNHGSISMTMSNIRQAYWIPSARATTRSVIRGCSLCRRRRTTPFTLPQTPQLPEFRVKPSQPFAHVGTDLAGPFTVKNAHCGDAVKTWIVLFTCLTSRAVHLELCFGLSAMELLRCLRKFISRRGRPLSFISDNGTNFHGIFKTVLSWKGEGDEDVFYCEDLDVKWTFIPSLSPWSGGFYERMIGLVKQTLRRTIPRRLLNIDEFATFITEAEAVVNCRPLTYVAEDSIILRPMDIICPRAKPGVPLSIQVEEDLPSTTVEELWSNAKNRVSKFWDCWKDDYLSLLRERSQKGLRQPRSTANRAPRVGEIVLLDEPNMSNASWKMAKIITLFPSTDGNIRSVEVQTANGRTSRRSIATVHPLELCTNNERKEDAQEEPPCVREERKGQYNLRPRKQQNYAFYVIAMLCLIASTESRTCPIGTPLVYRERCSTNGYVVGITANGACWDEINCQHGELRPLEEYELSSRVQCGPRCTCPHWSSGCVHHSEITDLHKLKERLFRLRPQVSLHKMHKSDIEYQETLPMVMIADQSTHFVTSLDISLIQANNTHPFICFGDGEATGDASYCRQHSCVNGTRFCITPNTEKAFLRSQDGPIPILAWGTRTVKMFRPPLLKRERPPCHLFLNCHKDGGLHVGRLDTCDAQFLEICIRSQCKRYDNSEATHFKPPRNILLSTQAYNVSLWNSGKSLATNSMVCAPSPVCKLIKCTFCLEYVTHLECFLYDLLLDAAILFVISAFLWATIALVSRCGRRTNDKEQRTEADPKQKVTLLETTTPRHELKDTDDFWRLFLFSYFSSCLQPPKDAEQRLVSKQR